MRSRSLAKVGHLIFLLGSFPNVRRHLLQKQGQNDLVDVKVSGGQGYMSQTGLKNIDQFPTSYLMQFIAEVAHWHLLLYRKFLTEGGGSEGYHIIMIYIICCFNGRKSS